jgi:ADP-ribose pyrophosphatase YjhB (NUDIX family)
MPEFDKPSATATVAIFRHGPTGFEVLLAKRSEKSDAYPGFWCLPGGFMNVKNAAKNIPGENLRATASRETLEETNLVVAPGHWRLVNEYSDPDTDPRTHVVNLGYSAVLSYEETLVAKSDDDVTELKWVLFEQAMSTKLAFNHNRILEEAWWVVDK